MSQPSLGPVLREIQDVARTLDRHLSEVESQVGHVEMQVGQVQSDLRLTTDELLALRKEFNEFVEQARRTANVQQSEIKVVNLKAQLDRDFGHYAEVRRTSTGMLQAFDVGNVSNDIVRAVSEELMIQTPRYWLAPALVALAAWSRDHQEIAEKSVKEAFSRDQNKTSLFFALVLRRQGRTDTAVRWLRHYLASLDPSGLTREFAIILEATSYDAFGPAGQRVVSDRMTEWCADLRSRVDVVEAQISSWQQEIAIQSHEVLTSRYANLARVSPDWPAVRKQLEAASALPQLLEKYAGVRDYDAALPAVLEDLLDDILDGLVTDYDEEELPLRREVAYHEAVIEENGDLDRAKKRADLLLKALEETDDVVSLQTKAAISPELAGVSTQTQRIAIGVGQQDFRSALGRYCAAYRSSYVDHVTLTLGPDHSNYAKTYAFPGWTTNTSVPEIVALTELGRVWADAFEKVIAGLRFTNTWYVKPSLIAFAATVIVFLIDRVAGVFALLVGAGVVYFLGEQAKKKAGAAIAAIEKNRDPAYANSVQLYRDASAEFVDAKLVFEDQDGFEADVLTLVDTWPTAQRMTEEIV